MKLCKTEDKYMDNFVNKYTLNQKIVAIEWISEFDSYRLTLENGTYILATHLY